MPASSSTSARALRAAALLLPLLLPLPASATLADLSLERLDRRGEFALAGRPQQVLMLTFFEPQCSWCQRQLRALGELAQSCDPQLQPVAVGINGREGALRRELRRARVRYPAVRASRELLRRVGDVPATPWTLLMDGSGTVLATLRGYVSAGRLAAAFADYCPAGEDGS